MNVLANRDWPLLWLYSYIVCLKEEINIIFSLKRYWMNNSDIENQCVWVVSIHNYLTFRNQMSQVLMSCLFNYHLNSWTNWFPPRKIITNLSRWALNFLFWYISSRFSIPSFLSDKSTPEATIQLHPAQHRPQCVTDVFDASSGSIALLSRGSARLSATVLHKHPRGGWWIGESEPVDIAHCDGA